MLASLYVLSKPTDTLHDQEFEKIWGCLYDIVRRNNKFQLAFYFFYCLRIIVFASSGLMMTDSTVQIVIVLFSNLAMLIYIGYTKPLISFNSNRVEMFNQLMVCSCCFFVPEFAKFSDSKEQSF